MNISLAFAPENVVYARQVQPSRPASALTRAPFLTHASIINLVLTHASSFPCLPLSVTMWHLNRRSKPSITIGSVPSLSGHALAHTGGVRRPRLRRHRASGSSSCQGSSSNDWCLFRQPRGTMKMRPSALTIIILTVIETRHCQVDRGHA